MLLVQRGEQPYAGRWALPGGFIRPGEDLPEAAARELDEETGLTGRVHIEQLASYGAPERDPRMRIVSISYLAFAPDLPDPPGGLGRGGRRLASGRPAAGARVRPRAHPRERPGARTRQAGVHTAGHRVRGREFTISELRAVYETVWGVPLHAGNFHRKILSVPGFVESTGETTESGGARGGPRAKLYRAGDARLLHPALLRPSREEEIR